LVEEVLMADSGRLIMGSEAEVIALLERDIAERQLSPGSKLPTERDLALRSGQSRAAVRRALQILEAQGRVVRHVGRGTFLAAKDAAESAGDAASISPADVMSLRMLVEPQSMPLVVAAATTAAIEKMRRCMLAAENAGNYAEFETWDAALHRSFAVGAHNPLLVRVLDLTNEARQHPMWGRLKQLSHTPERRREYERDHRAIVAALSERDGPAAQQAMRDHLARVRTYLLGDSR
jgi:GntR family transcriptional regulator, uxu operon transcriptional repressor